MFVYIPLAVAVVVFLVSLSQSVPADLSFWNPLPPASCVLVPSFSPQLVSLALHSSFSSEEKGDNCIINELWQFPTMWHFDMCSLGRVCAASY